MCLQIIYYVYFGSIFFFFHHTTCESTCYTISSSAAIQGCVITPGWRLMRIWYSTCFHTLYDEKKKKKFWQHFFVNTNFIKHNRHFLSTYFLLDPSIFLYCFYRIRRELIMKMSIMFNEICMKSYI